MNCPHCGRSIKKRMIPEEFKKMFQVGDVIAGWSTGKQVTITGIGDTRFFYRDSHRDNKEFVEAMHNYYWRLVSRNGMIPEGK